MWTFGVLPYRILILVLSFRHFVGCIANSMQSQFNASLRDYSQIHDMNSTHVKTMQKEDPGRYANFAPIKNPIAYREIPDNTISGSSYSHGLSHHDDGGYGLHDYEESPHYGHVIHGSYDHHGDGYEYDHGGHHHDYDHHGHGHGHGHGHAHSHGHHLGYGHHGYHKHYDHGLSAKAILLPVAGLAILGAAAALVSNPILLQLGVVSGRRRRDTSEVTTGPEVDFDKIKRWVPRPEHKSDNLFDVKLNGFQRKSLEIRKYENKKPLLRRLPVKRTVDSVTLDAHSHHEESDDNFIPVPLKLKSVSVAN